MIREILEEDLNIDENTYIFTDTGEKVDIQRCATEYIEKWKNSVYQKDTKTDFFFWYGEENLIGLKENMEELLKQENIGIMEFPSITEEDFVGVIKQMKMKKQQGLMTFLLN